MDGVDASQAPRWYGVYHLRGDLLKPLHYFVCFTLGEIIPLDFG